MADQFLKYGTTYTGMVGKADSGSFTTNDLVTWHIGRRRHFLVAKLTGTGGGDPDVIVTCYRWSTYGQGVKVTLAAYRLDSLTVSEPAEPTVSNFGTTAGGTISINLKPYAAGLYRIKVTNENDDPMIPFSMGVSGAQFFCVESIEPYAAFNTLGNSTHDIPAQSKTPIKQYFFVPQNAGDFWVKLEGDGHNDCARLSIHKASDDSRQSMVDIRGYNVDYLEVKATGATGDEDPAYYNEGKLNLGTSQTCGTLCYFKLYRPDNDNLQPAGINWVRFSRNIPNYYSPYQNRLMLPVVHPFYQNAYYVDQSRTHKAFLCMKRTDMGTLDDAALKIKVSGDAEVSTTSGYVVQKTKSSSTRIRWSLGSCYAWLVKDSIIAKGTDRVDTVAVVREPAYKIDVSGEGNWRTGWPNPLYLAWTDENGLDRANIHEDAIRWDTPNYDNYIVQGGSGIGLKSRNFHVILHDAPSHLNENDLSSAETDDGWRMKAMGATFSGSMGTHFTNNGNDRYVAIWHNFDEPILGGTPLKDLYDDYWTKTGNTERPILINLDKAFQMEDCIGAMDVLCSDPYTVPFMGRNKNILKDFILASKGARTRDGTAAKKKIAIVLWGYYDPYVQEPDYFETQHGIVKGYSNNAVDVIGMFTYCFGGGAAATFKRLYNRTGGPGLWTRIDVVNTPRT